MEQGRISHFYTLYKTDKENQSHCVVKSGLCRGEAIEELRKLRSRNGYVEKTTKILYYSKDDIWEICPTHYTYKYAIIATKHNGIIDIVE